LRVLYCYERRLDERLVGALRELHHAVETARLGDGADLARLEPWQLIACDLILLRPEPAAALRAAAPRAWLIVLADQDDPAARIATLRAGADAVFGRPYAFREFSAKLDALARREASAPGTSPEQVSFALAPAEQAAILNGEHVRLAQREYALLALLAGRPGEVMAIGQILDVVWGDQADPDPQLVRTYVSRLRGKLERGRSWRLLHALRGHGYCFRIETAS
jgi:DNA-binding response OmpR family regulator